MNKEFFSEGTKIQPLWLYWNFVNEKPILKILLKNIDNNKIVYFPIKLETQLDFKVSMDKYCIGYPDEEDNIILCKENKRIHKGIQCEDCMKKDNLFGCVFCRGHKCFNLKAWSYCQKEEHKLYLAMYTNKFIKIGTSNKKRVYPRLLEQGAQMALIIANFKTQKEAKLYESMISKEFSIAQRTNKKIQIESLFMKLNLEESSTKLNELFNKIRQKYKDLDYCSEYVNLFINKPEKLKVFNKLNFKEEFSIQGGVSYLQGKNIIVGGNILNMRDLLGKVIIIGKKVKIPQKSLFDYN